MASARVEWLLHLVDTWNAGDVDELADALGPEFEFTPDPSFPDAGTYRGEEVRRWMHWARTWQDNELEVLGATEYQRGVLLECRWHLAAPQSGEGVPVSDFNIVFGFDQADRPARMAAFFDRERAVALAQEGTG